eukprot:3955373-Pyramimonas_sp.AAC.2
MEDNPSRERRFMARGDIQGAGFAHLISPSFSRYKLRLSTGVPFSLSRSAANWHPPSQRQVSSQPAPSQRQVSTKSALSQRQASVKSAPSQRCLFVSAPQQKAAGCS